jgi:hypothetical protein
VILPEELVVQVQIPGPYPFLYDLRNPSAAPVYFAGTVSFRGDVYFFSTNAVVSSSKSW